MLSGIAGALVFSSFFSGIEFLYYFPVLFAISIAGCLIGTYTAPATDEQVLKDFYRTVKPWGFWKPVQRLVISELVDFEPNKRFKLDMFNVVLGVIAQLCLTILPMYFILWMKLPLIITIGIIIVIGIILKRTWWNK
jgi:SSS family solute:Na+ symporter